MHRLAYVASTLAFSFCVFMPSVAFAAPSNLLSGQINALLHSIQRLTAGETTAVNDFTANVAAIQDLLEAGKEQVLGASTGPGMSAAEVAANRLIELGPGDYAVTTHTIGKPAGKTKRVEFTLPSGTVVWVDIDQNATASLTAPSEGTPAYVSGIDPDVEIYNEYDQVPGADENGIPNSVKKWIEKTGSAAVIIQMNLPFKRFYEKGDTAAQKASKKAQFNSAKQSVKAAMGKDGREKFDLEIINGFSATINAEALKGITRNPHVAGIHPVGKARLALSKSIPYIGAEDTGSRFVAVETAGIVVPVTGIGVKIAVIDTGVDYVLPALGGCFGPTCKVIGGYNFITPGASILDLYGHGTAVALIAAGADSAKEGQVPLTGVAPGARILAYKVVFDNGKTDAQYIIAGINRAVQDGADIINLSLSQFCLNGGLVESHVNPGPIFYNDKCGPTDLTSQAVNNASAKGVTVVVAAGNGGPASPSIWPLGTAASAITVANGCPPDAAPGDPNCAGQINHTSSIGPVIYKGIDYKKPDITAPGTSICTSLSRIAILVSSSSWCHDRSHFLVSGTSFAAPHVAGVAALLKQANPSWAPADIKNFIKSNAVNLGLGYSAQGAGMVHLSSIPGATATKVKAQPSPWKVRSKKNSQRSENAQTFTVDGGGLTGGGRKALAPATSHLAAAWASLSTLALRNTDSKSVTIGFTPVFSDPGITFSSDIQTLDFSASTTATFTGTIAVDNDVTEPGTYFAGYVTFTDAGGTLVGALPVFVTVEPSFTLSIEGAPTEDSNVLDYGVYAPSLTSWTSAPQNITITNQRTDKAETITFSIDYFMDLGETPLYGQVTLNAQTVTVPAGGSITVPTSLSVPYALPINIYSGFINISDGSYTTSIPATFARFYVLNIDSTVTPTSIYLSGITSQIPPTDKTTTVYLADDVSVTGRPYTAVVDYQDTVNGEFDERTVIKDGITFTDGVANVSADPSMATHKIGAVTPNALWNTVGVFIGGPMNAARSLSVSTNLKSPNDPGYRYVSDVGDDFTYYLWNIGLVESAASLIDLYAVGNYATGVSTDSVVSPALSEYAALTASIVSSPTGSSAVTVNTTAGLEFPWFSDTSTAAASTTTFETLTPAQLTTPARATVHWYPNARSSSYAQFSLTSTPGSVYFYDIESPMVTMTSPDPETFERTTPFGAGLPLPPATTSSMPLGLAPIIWNGEFHNEPKKVVATGQWGTSYELFLRQGYNFEMYAAKHYTIMQNGSTVASGDIPPSGLRNNLGVWEWQPSSLSATVPTSGLTTLFLDFPYKANGTDLNANVRATFDTGLADPNPPSISELTYSTNGVQTQEYYALAATDTLLLGFDPAGGAVASVAASYSTDGAAFSPLTVATTTSTAGTRYTVAPPAGLLATKLTMRIVATDDSDNVLQYTFELPITNAVPPGGAGGSVTAAGLSATPANIALGQTSTLSWSSTNATTCTGTGFSTGDATSGSVSVSPETTTTYTLTCTGAGGASAPASATVTVTAVSATLSASATVVPEGWSSTLSWSSANATSCTGTGFSTGGATSGSVSVSPETTTTYTLTCTGAADASQTATARVEVAGPVYRGMPVVTNAEVKAVALPSKPQSNSYCILPAGTAGTIYWDFSKVGDSSNGGYTFWSVSFSNLNQFLCKGSNVGILWIPQQYLTLRP